MDVDNCECDETGDNSWRTIKKPMSNFDRAINFDRHEKTTCLTVVTQTMMNGEFVFDQPLRNVRAVKIEMIACSDFATAANVVFLFSPELGSFQRNVQSGFNSTVSNRILRYPLIWTQPAFTLTMPNVGFISQLPSRWNHFTTVKEFSSIRLRLDTQPTGLGLPGPAFSITWRITTKHVNLG